MKIIKRIINFKTKTFSVHMLIEPNTDDAWNIFNLLGEGDFVYGTCHRKMAKESLTGLVKNERRKMTLLLKVQKFDYDADADLIRVLGTNAKESNYLGLGAHQAMDIRAPMKLTLIKRHFDSMHVRKLNEAASEAQAGSLLAITMEEGIAHIFLVSRSTTKLKAKIEKHISKKKAFGGKTDKQKGKFFGQIVSSLEVLLTGSNGGPELFGAVRAVVIGSPGFYKDQFAEHLQEEAEKKKSTVLKAVAAMAVLAHCSSGFKHSLAEILNNKAVKERVASLQCCQEQEHLDHFFETLRTQDGKVCYGLRSTKFALENKAVETLLISDHLFRAKNTAVRKEYVSLAETAERKNGVKVVIFSSMTPAGQRLKDLTGIAAVLFFPLPGLDDIDEDSDSSSDGEGQGRSGKSDGGDGSGEEESKQSSAGEAFEDEQLHLLMNEGMIGYEDTEDLQA